MFNVTGAKLGAPDTGLISYAEMVDQGRYIHEATKSMPIIGDGDTGDNRNSALIMHHYYVSWDSVNS